MEDGICHKGAAESMSLNFSSVELSSEVLCLLVFFLSFCCVVFSLLLSLLEKPNSRFFLVCGLAIVFWSTCMPKDSRITADDVIDFFRISSKIDIVNEKFVTSFY